MSWYHKGVDDESLEKAEKEGASSTQRRLWIPKGAQKRVVFLDDEPFCFWEHNPKINGQFKDNWYTCRKGLDDNGCPLCASKVSRYYVGFVTVLDVDGFTSKKDGKVYKNFRQLLPMKTDTLKRFKIYKQRKTTLVGARYALARVGEKAPTCGDDWDFEDYVDLDDKQFWYESKLEGKKKRPEPFDYLELFKPLSPKEMMSLGVGSSGAGGSGYSGGDQGDSYEGDAGGEDEDALY